MSCWSVVGPHCLGLVIPDPDFEASGFGTTLFEDLFYHLNEKRIMGWCFFFTPNRNTLGYLAILFRVAMFGKKCERGQVPIVHSIFFQKPAVHTMSQLNHAGKKRRRRDPLADNFRDDILECLRNPKIVKTRV